MEEPYKDICMRKGQEEGGAGKGGIWYHLKSWNDSHFHGMTIPIQPPSSSSVSVAEPERWSQDVFLLCFATLATLKP
jgi:hypothetical protein